MRVLGFVVLILAYSLSFSQYTFEGTVVISGKINGTIAAADLKLKNEKVLIRQTEGANKKYSYFLVDLNSRILQTVSMKDTAVVIKYHLDTLLQFYEANEIKEGFKNDYGYILKETEKSYSDGRQKLTKAVAEDNTRKITAWVTEDNLALNELVPFLRLIGTWPEAQSHSKKIIMQADVVNKTTKKESSVKVSVFNEKLPDTLFDLPGSVIKKDFAQLMQQQRLNKDLKVLIHTFAAF